jgi:hypothetical protein
VHNNSNLTCAIDIRVGGHEPSTSDLLEVAMIPLNHSYVMHPEFSIFQIKIRPSWKVDKKVARLNADNIEDFEKSPFDGIESADMCARWFETLQMRTRKKIIPLVWDWSHIKPYLQIWLGTWFEEIISDMHREVMSAVNFVNDRCDLWGEEVPVKACNFKQALCRHEIELIENNSLSANCLGLIKLNRSMLSGFIPGFMTRKNLDKLEG